MRAFAAFPPGLFEDGRIRTARERVRSWSSTRARRVPHRTAQHLARPGHPIPGRGPRSGSPLGARTLSRGQAIAVARRCGFNLTECATSLSSVTTSGSCSAQALGRISLAKWRVNCGEALLIAGRRNSGAGRALPAPTSPRRRPWRNARQIISEISRVQRHSGVPPRLSLGMEEPTRRIGPWKQGGDGCRGAGRIPQVGGAPVVSTGDDRSTVSTNQSPTSARSCTGSRSTAARRSGDDAGCVQPTRRNAGPRRPLLAWLRTLTPELAAFSPHEAQQARRADYSETGGRRDPTGFVHGRPSPRSGSSPATCCSKRQELKAKPDGTDAHHQMPAGAG